MGHDAPPGEETAQGESERGRGRGMQHLVMEPRRGERDSPRLLELAASRRAHAYAYKPNGL